MENQIKLLKWWAGLTPRKQLVVALVSGMAILTIPIKVLWNVHKQTDDERLNALTNCVTENKRLEADFRAYLMQENRRKEQSNRESDSLINLIKNK